MNRTEFEKLAQEGFLLIPEKVRERIQNVALLIEDELSEEVREREGLGEDKTLLGLYQGIPATARGDAYGIGPTVPDTITLYRLPIEEVAAEEGKDIRAVIAETIWHEYAHYFGMNEDEIRFRESLRAGNVRYGDRHSFSIWIASVGDKNQEPHLAAGLRSKSVQASA